MSAIPIVLMLATLTDRRDFGDDWLLERKFDGVSAFATTSAPPRSSGSSHGE